MDRLKPTIVLITSSDEHSEMQTHAKAFAAVAQKDLGYEILEVNTSSLSRDAEGIDARRLAVERIHDNAVSMILVPSTSHGIIPCETQREIDAIRNDPNIPVLALNGHNTKEAVEVRHNIYVGQATNSQLFNLALEKRDAFFAQRDIMQMDTEVDISGYWEDLNKLMKMTDSQRQELISLSENVHKSSNYLQHCFGLAIDGISLIGEWIGGFGMHYKAIAKLEEMLDVVDAMRRERRGNTSLQPTREIFWGLLWKLPGIRTPIYQIFLDPESMPFLADDNIQDVGKYLLEEGRCIPVDNNFRLIDGNYTMN